MPATEIVVILSADHAHSIASLEGFVERHRSEIASAVTITLGCSVESLASGILLRLGALGIPRRSNRYGWFQLSCGRRWQTDQHGESLGVNTGRDVYSSSAVRRVCRSCAGSAVGMAQAIPG